MQSPYEWISLIVQVGMLAVLVHVAWTLRQVNAKTGVSFYLGGSHHAHYAPIHHAHYAPLHHGLNADQLSTHKPAAGIQVEIAYSIWIFRGGSWVLLKPCGQSGCACSSAPTGTGQYEGQVIRKECSPK